MYAGTFGVCDLTFPARASDPWTLPMMAVCLVERGVVQSRLDLGSLEASRDVSTMYLPEDVSNYSKEQEDKEADRLYRLQTLELSCSKRWRCFDETVVDEAFIITSRVENQRLG